MLTLAFVLPFLFYRFTKRPILASLAACLLLGIPMLFLVGSIVDSIRYGEFYHPDAAQLNDGYVELPKDATDITLHKYASGHELKFTTNKASLEEWMADQRLEYSDATSFQLEDSRPDFQAEEFSLRFGELGWSFPVDAVVYRGWRSGRGGGFDVWFSETQQSACISGSYW